MVSFSNAQKLAAVISEWARPAISQIASSKLCQLPVVQSLQATIIGSGIVGSNYKITSDIESFIQPVVNSILSPLVEKYVSNIPDQSIPSVAKSVVDHMKSVGQMSILDGFITFEAEDIEELSSLLEKNLPVFDSENYQVIH